MKQFKAKNNLPLTSTLPKLPKTFSSSRENKYYARSYTRSYHIIFEHHMQFLCYTEAFPRLVSDKGILLFRDKDNILLTAKQDFIVAKSTCYRRNRYMYSHGRHNSVPK